MRILALALALTGGISSLSASAENGARCYDFLVETPEREAEPERRAERWCYEDVSGGLYIFNADGEKVKPELALLKTKDGKIAHGSLAGGKLAVVSAENESFSPLAVPLEEPKARGAKTAPAEIGKSATAVLALLRSAKPTTGDAFAVKAGKSSVDASYMPWRGYWWPYAGMPMLNPMAKFDDILRSRGARSDAVSWESSRHADRNIYWEGHCNGWAAASILRAEPVATHYDGQSGQSLSISEQKGLWTEGDYCARAAFFGFRTATSSGIDAAEFHRALVYYVGQLRKPIAFNTHTDGTVDNNVISGYTMDMQASGAGYVVTTTLRVHRYEGEAHDVPGVAPSYSLTYQYNLSVDANGNPVGGSWISASPGFVWAPLGAGRCAHGNPYLDIMNIEGVLGQ